MVSLGSLDAPGLVVAITEEVEAHGSGEVKFVGLPAALRRLVTVNGAMSGVLVTPMRLPHSVAPSIATVATQMNAGGAGGWITRSTVDGDGVAVSLSGWAEIMTSSSGQTDWGYPLGFTNTALTLAQWQDQLTIGGGLTRNGLAIAGAGAPSTFTANPDLTAGRVEKIGVISDIFRTNWRVGLDSADGFPILDFADLDTLAGGSGVRTLISPDIPSGVAGAIRVIGGRVRAEIDSTDFVTKSHARTGGGATLAEYLAARAVSVSTSAANNPFRHPFGTALGRERRTDTSIEPAKPSPPPSDTTTQASLTAIAAAEIKRFGRLRTQFSVDVDGVDVAQIRLGSRVWVYQPDIGAIDAANNQVVGHWPCMPIEMRVTARTVPVSAQCGVYLWSMHKDSHRAVFDLTDWVVPDDDGAIIVAPVTGRTRMAADIVGRQRR